MTTPSFKEFFAIYAVLEKWTHIPEFHNDILEFLGNNREWENNTGTLQVFRNGAKSTITAAFIVYELIKDPTQIFLVQSADDLTAQKMVSDCKKIINIHPHAQHLKSKNCIWSARGFEVRGATSGRNLSVSARGIMSNVTGARADFLIFDDVEVKKNVETADAREKVRSRISETHHLLNPGGRTLFVGTPHSYDSIYPETIDRGCASLTIPFITSIQGEFPNLTGACAWPERWDDEEILKKQRYSRTKAEFLSQYLLIPSSIDDAYLDPVNLVTYNHEIEITSANKSRLLRLGDQLVSSTACFWDPSMANSRGDSSVVSLVYGGRDGEIYIHRVIEVKGDAEAQCDQVKNFLIQYHIPSITIETNGIGNYLPQMLLKRVRGLGIGVTGAQTMQSKRESIIEAYEVPMSARIVHVHRSVLETKFMTQMRDFNPRFMRGHDDFIDAPAKAILSLPVRLGRGQPNTIDGFSVYRSGEVTVEIERDRFQL